MEMGKDLEVIQTEGLGFLAIAGDAKVQLTPSWSPPPAPTASLLSIASRKGLVATAGPDALYLASTESVRKAFENESTDDTDVRPFDPQAKIPLPMRISHLVFTPDEQYLILSAEQGGGLAVYETQTLLQGSSQAAFEISTSGESVKALIPNPMSNLAEFCAVITNNGNLLMANLGEKSLVNGSNGPVIRSQVTSAAWSTKGKQLVAGLADGTAAQMAPDGTEKAQIPKPDALGDVHVASIAWLENNVFLVVHTQNSGAPPGSEYHIVTRHAPAGQTPSFEFRKLSDPVEPFGNTEAPQYSVLRLRDYPPNIQDMLFVASTAHDGMGLLTRSKVPLATDLPAEDITNVFTTTEFTDDSKRAELPSNPADYSSTYPIGVSLDLSSKDNVYRPIPADEEIDQSPGPLPALWALNTIGVLSAWWVVYNDAIREGKTYPGMAAVEGESAPQSAGPSTGSTFGAAATSSPFGGPSAFGITAPALAAPATGASNPFGGSAAATSGPTFGAPSFGTPSFGSKPAAPAFGQSAGLGAKTSPWAAASTGAAPAFGSHGFSGSAAPTMGGSTGGKVFGSGAAAASPSTGGGFASFASKGGFASLGGNNSGGSIFSQPSSSSPFGSNTSGQSVFGKPSNAPEVSMGSGTAFPAPSSPAKEGSAFGSSPFVLGTTFKADTASANDNEKPSGSGGFGLGGFGLSLNDAASKPADSQNSSKDEDMDAPIPSVEQEKPRSIFQESTTPTSTPAPSKFFSTDSTASKPNPFSAQPSASSPFASTAAKPNPFGSTNDAEKPKPSPSPFGSVFSNKPNPFASNDKPNPFASKDSAETAKPTEAAADAPLPPESMSKAAYPFGESSSSSIASAKSVEVSKQAADKPSESAGDAPLPPDFLSQPKEKPKTSEDSTSQPVIKEESPAPEEAPLPPDFTNPKADSKSSWFTSKEPPTVPEGPDSGEDSLEEEEGSDDNEPEDEDEDEGEDEGEDEEAEDGSEGSGVDVANDLSPDSTGAGQTPGLTPQGSFGGMAGSGYSMVSRPDAAQPQRHSLFGEIGRNAPVFPTPASNSSQTSPFRNSVPEKMLSGEGSRSVGAPGMASQILGGSRSQSSGYGSKTISARLQPQEDPNVALQKQAQKKQAEKEEQRLEDDEFEVVQNMLESEIEPSLDIGEFNAFNSVPADAHASTVAAQVEALYRDINGMLVTLGLNARALSGFIKGHEQLRNGDQKTQDDLANPDDWVLCETEDLSHILDDEMAPELEEGRLQDLDDTWDTCQGLVREIPKLRAKHQDIKRILGTALDPDQAATARSLPLSAEQAAQQNELRQAYAKMTKLIADAEGALTMLKTKLASLAGPSGKSAAVPTVDAVMRTILRMTSAAEKRSGDLDVLESQMRKLRFSSSVGPSSRDGSPMTPPPTNKRQSLLMSGSVHTPSPRKSLMSSVGSINGTPGRATPTPRKKISGYTEDDKSAVRTKMQKRQAVLDRLRGKLVEGGPKMSRYGEGK